MKINENLYKLIIAIAILIAALSVAYYYVIVLPSQENEKTQREVEAQSKKEIQDNVARNAQIEIDQRNIAKEVQDDCIKSAKNTTEYFDLESTHASPLFYPYDDGYSFNKNERLITALGSYQSCITSDPRYSDNNESLQEIYYDAQYAEISIKEHLAKVKEDNPGICTASVLSAAAKQFCDNLGSIEAAVRSRFYITQSKDGEYKTAEETQKLVDMYMEIVYSNEDNN